MRRWEYTDGGSDKFWEAGAEGTEVTVRYGRRDTAGRTKITSFDSPAEARRHLAYLTAPVEAAPGVAELGPGNGLALP